MDGLGTIYLENLPKRANPMQIAFPYYCTIESGA